MSMVAHVGAAARVVRTTSLALAVAMLVGFVSVQAFAAHYGVPVRTVVLDSHTDGVLTSAIRAQEATGLRCSETPALTDVVLFQHARGERVAVMTFTEAEEAATARRGWIRSYCV